MLQSLKLLAPALIPSWRFFDTITASPRIEVLRLSAAEEPVGAWREFRPRPHSLPCREILRRLVWNPRWNETLFLTSCAERLLERETAHSVAEIATRIAASLTPHDAPFFRFRLVLISRDGDALQKEVAYVSPRRDVISQ
ncbi:MAG: hypothetical protein ACFB13_04155 [Kiloniellaceae bacterium]